MINLSEWHSCINEKPAAEGCYLVARFDAEGELVNALSLHFTPEYGWNTFAEAHGHPITFNPDDKYDRRAFWATITME